jgi:hypothetical protein
MRTMKKSITFAFAVGILLLVGCAKPSPVTMGHTSSHVTDWGVIELYDRIPKHLNLEGKDCVITATPFTHDKLFVSIEIGEYGSGTKAYWREETFFFSNVETISSFDRKMVRFTLKLKTS